MELRPYQNESIQAVFNEWDDKAGHRKILCVLPTGTGKTVVFASIADIIVNRGGKVLVLAHREELLYQAMDKIKTVTDIQASLDKAESKIDCSDDHSIVIGSVQTLCRQKRLNNYPKDYFDAIIVDEAHHITSDSYKRIINYFDTPKVLGVTATPDRSDKRTLDKFFEKTVYDYSLSDAVNDGYLSRIIVESVPFSIDMTKAVKNNFGDYKDSSVADILTPQLNGICDVIAERCKNRKTVVFAPLVRISQDIASRLNNRGLKTIEINGESEDRKQILEDFESGKYDCICNAMLLTEGWDSPRTDCVVVLRPTQSRALYTQMVGRGTRFHPDKENLKIIDFLWLSKEHDICSSPQLMYDKDEKAAKLMSKKLKNGTTDLFEAEEEAIKDITEETRQKLSERLKMTGGTVTEEDCFDLVSFREAIKKGKKIDFAPSQKWHNDEATPKQKSTLIKMGIPFNENISKGEACALIGKGVEIHQSEPATYKQKRWLKTNGFNTYYQWPKYLAGMVIGAVKAGVHIPNKMEYNPEDEASVNKLKQITGRRIS